MFYNPMELEIWKTCIAMAERRTMRNYQTRDLKSPEVLMWQRLLGLLGRVRLLFNTRFRPSFSPLRYAVQQK